MERHFTRRRTKKRLSYVENLYERKAGEAMKRDMTDNQAVFNPQMYKSFTGALEAFFEQECPQLGGFRTRQVVEVFLWMPPTLSMKHT